MWCLQREAYAVEAALIGDDRIPPLHESLGEFVEAPLRWTLAHDVDDRLLGAVAVADGTVGAVEIDRLVVSPAHARRGIGAALVAGVLLEAARVGRGEVTVSTARANAPARRLYESLVFTTTCHREVEPGLWVTDLVWQHRAAVRVLCLAPDGRVLLLCWRDPTNGRLHWEPPGGGVEAGETALEAAGRELAEETGLPAHLVLPGSVAVERDIRWTGRRHVRVEQFFVARTDDAPPLSRAGLRPDEVENLVDHAWVHPADFAALSGTLEPPSLAVIMAESTT